MTNLRRLYDEQGQSPWIDNLTRPGILGGGLQSLVEAGVRGVTSNPTIFEKAMTGSDAYDEQFRSLTASKSVTEAFWDMAIEDVTGACELMAPIHDASGGTDGFVSLEVSPALASDTAATIASARSLHARIGLPNLMVKIPATKQGVPAIRAMIAEGHNINVTLIFSLQRYAEVIEAYLSGLEDLIGSGGNPANTHSVASFFVSRVDTEVDRRLEKIGGGSTALAGKAAVAQARLAYELFDQHFNNERWARLAAQGAHPQRPLWASTSTKNPAYPDLLYVESLIGPNTVNTMPDATIDAFLDHGKLARTVDTDLDASRAHLEKLAEVGISMEEVAQVLEAEGVASFSKSFEQLMSSLEDKANALMPEER